MSIDQEKVRLNKFIAQSGLCGRNEASEWIKAGHVKVNDEVVKIPFTEVGADDVVTVKNKRVVPKIEYTYYVINKPWHIPIENAATDDLPSLQALIQKQTIKSLSVIGMPDVDTCGLVVMTDDSDLLEKLKISGHKLKTVYEVTLDKKWEAVEITEKEESPKMDAARIMGVQLPKPNHDNIVGVEMLGGLYQDVVDYFEARGYKVTKVDCTFFGGITKKDLKRGWSRPLSEKETVFIKHFT